MPLLRSSNVCRGIDVQFSQIRMGFSNLNDQLFLRGCTENRKCECGAPREDAKHYFLHCQNYRDIRNDIFNNIQSICEGLHITLNILLYGKESLSVEQNTAIMHHTCQFIEKSKRF